MDGEPLMTDAPVFDAADAAHREIHVALGGSLTSTDVGALIDRASKHVAECDVLAAVKASAASDATLPTRDALIAKQESDALIFVADRLRNLVPILDRRLASERDGEDQARRSEQYDQAQQRVNEIVSRVRKEYPKAVATLVDLVAEIEKADAIAADANRNIPRDFRDIPTVEKTVGAEILSRLHLPALDGTLAHEMTSAAADAHKVDLWNREQQARHSHWTKQDEAMRKAALAERRAAAEAHNGTPEEKSNILMGFPPQMIGIGRPARVA